jgi:hypothetical protein
MLGCDLRPHTANEVPGRIQKYKCLVPIYVFLEMKLRGLVISKTEFQNVLSPNFDIHESVSDLYIPRICLTILLQPNRQTDPGTTVYSINRSQTHECRNWERGCAVSFLGKRT